MPIELLDERTIEALKKGNEKAKTQVYTYFSKKIYLYVQSIVKNNEEANDITAETFLEFFNKPQHFKTGAAINKFLFITARNKSFNYLKLYKGKLANSNEPVKTGEDVSDRIIARLDIMNFIDQEIRKTDPVNQEIIKMYIRGFSTEDIAEHLGMNKDNIRKRKERALKETGLKEILKKYLLLVTLGICFMIIL